MNPKATRLYSIHEENYKLNIRISEELAKQEKIQQEINECEDSLVEYHNMLNFDQENHDKQLRKMKELNESYLKTIEIQRNSMKNNGENQILKEELSSLIQERNNLLSIISEIETEEENSQIKQENDLKQYIQYLKDQLKLANN